ncbi:NAD(P) transhydrogenase subunit alpha [Hahella sp. CCB-MM4]|uniref:Re/Si-specific NAD(P)(+) transhydrogenase subunit alpha n=1 Tax=Hahella sp. (strain CCB-MM4) TaxID=1926491 RepID=UPI000B9B561D|nr:Re/Si-specific NAD(P)(+) transhydrogenase subunit alpha [Hahella sp. CCB-MM4]OZG69895.1 NAD(P) transhydrogenase subunit alpha [Hahella sp. CCB-MM4]
MQIGIPKEHKPHEKRVAASPDSVKELIKLGFTVVVENHAGGLSSFHDDAYEAAGAKVVEVKDVWQSDIILKVNEPNENEVELIKPGATLISFLWPAVNEDLIKQLAEKKITAMAMDSVPRISRAQSMDALSSMASIVGYRAVVEASHHFGRFFSGQITAAGKVPPAKILVIGAGVAGLAAIGTAGSLGAIVRAFDTRPEVKEQITSMGAEFLEVDIEEETGSGDGYAKEMSQAFIDAEMALFLEQAKDVDIIISTASIPGKPAPKLITEEMVKAMKPGSVIVDLAAPNGGNCELTEPGESVERYGVTIAGFVDLPSRLPAQSSLLYANNLVNLMKLLCKTKDGIINVDFEDIIIRGVTVTKDGDVTWPPPPVKVSAAPKPKAAQPAAEPAPKKEMPKELKHGLMLGAGVLFLWLASVAPMDFLSHFTVFLLACIVGYHVVWSVTHALHTPLMSVTNAISGIIVVGALLQISSSSTLVMLLAAAATLVATINIVGGFVVTQRMLKMFRR